MSKDVGVVILIVMLGAFVLAATTRKMCPLYKGQAVFDIQTKKVGQVVRTTAGSACSVIVMLEDNTIVEGDNVFFREVK